MIVVDDGSTDGTAAALDGLPVTLIRNPRNLGKAASLWRGIEVALAEDAGAVVTLDGDGQHRPEDIPRLLAAHRRDPDALIVGARLHDSARHPRRALLRQPLRQFLDRPGPRASASRTASRASASIRRRCCARCRRAWRRAASFVFESEILIEAGRRGAKLAWVPIPAIYEPAARAPAISARWWTSLLIARMVAWKLLSRGLYLRGLVRSLRAAS